MSWYYAVNGQQAGPVEDAEMQQMAAAGAINASTLVWRAGMDVWATLGSLVAPVSVPTEQCQQCRKPYPVEQTITLAGGPVCGACKPIVLQRIREGLAPLSTGKPFAGFWIRLVARMIDNTITSIAGYIFQIPMLIVVARMDKQTGPDLSLLAGTGALAVLLSVGAAAYYEAWFLVKKGATPGKMILGLKVVRARGGPMTWGLGLGRYFAHMLSAFTLYIGYMMAGWDEEKRALHDRICDTRVMSGG
ncbi:MAG: RDD family protein [Acidobacteria bacterium]|nr:RDD family protein [Acidobacteriota bacterium]